MDVLQYVSVDDEPNRRDSSLQPHKSHTHDHSGLGYGDELCQTARYLRCSHTNNLNLYRNYFFLRFHRSLSYFRHLHLQPQVEARRSCRYPSGYLCFLIGCLCLLSQLYLHFCPLPRLFRLAHCLHLCFHQFHHLKIKLKKLSE